MSRLPYICHFRSIIHTFDGWHEDFELTTWVDTFTFRNIKQFEKDKNDLSKYLDPVSNIQITSGSQSYYNDRMMSGSDCGKESIECSDLISRIVDCDIKPNPEEEHYYEIIGKYHFHSYQTYEGEWDSDDDVSDIKFQELAVEDVEEWAKDQGLKLFTKDKK